MGSWESHEPVRLERCENGHLVRAGAACAECAAPAASVTTGVPEVFTIPGFEGPPVERRRRRPGRVAILLGAALLALVLFGVFVYFPNRSLQSSMRNVISGDARNAGMEVSVHYAGWFDRSTLVYDLEHVGFGHAPIDVFRVLLQYAEEVQDKDFEEVVLAFRGEPKFRLKGDYFQTLGREYSFQNPTYTARTFPENLYLPEGGRAYETWTGGLLGVLNAQLEDFNDFHDEWYKDDLVAR